MKWAWLAPEKVERTGKSPESCILFKSLILYLKSDNIRVVMTPGIGSRR